MTTYREEPPEDIRGEGDQDFNLSPPDDEFHKQETEDLRFQHTDEFFTELGNTRDQINRAVEGDEDDANLPSGIVLTEHDDVLVGIPLDEPGAQDDYKIEHVRLSGALDPKEAVRQALEALGYTEP